MIIRPFIKEKDRKAVRQIACDTAFLELSYKLFVDDAEILADALTLYFTDYEPESCFVAIENNKVVGYIIGTKNVKTMGKIFSKRIFPELLKKILLKRILLKKNTFIFLCHLFISAIKGEFFAPNFSEKYPALLHINIAKDFRRQKMGEKLIEHYLTFLKKNSVCGVHLGTMSEKAKEFFKKCGLVLLFEGKRSYLKYYLKKIIPYYILGRLL